MGTTRKKVATPAAVKAVAKPERKPQELSEGFKAKIGKGQENLIPFTKETAQAARLKGLRTRQAQKKAKEDFVNRVKVYHMIMHKLPEIDAEKVIRMRIHMALQEQDFETAAHWAKELMEFQRPKLARKEVTIDNGLEKLSLEELKKMATAEGLI
jgi:hypothetical protein